MNNTCLHARITAGLSRHCALLATAKKDQRSPVSSRRAVRGRLQQWRVSVQCAPAAGLLARPSGHGTLDVLATPSNERMKYIMSNSDERERKNKTKEAQIQEQNDPRLR